MINLSINLLKDIFGASRFEQFLVTLLQLSGDKFFGSITFQLFELNTREHTG